MTSILEQIMVCIKEADEEIATHAANMTRDTPMAKRHAEGVRDGLNFAMEIVQKSIEAERGSQ